jgi:hypothetical protein
VNGFGLRGSKRLRHRIDGRQEIHESNQYIFESNQYFCESNQEIRESNQYIFESNQEIRTSSQDVLKLTGNQPGAVAVRCF